MRLVHMSNARAQRQRQQRRRLDRARTRRRAVAVGSGGPRCARRLARCIRRRRRAARACPIRPRAVERTAPGAAAAAAGDASRPRATPDARGRPQPAWLPGGARVCSRLGIWVYRFARVNACARAFGIPGSRIRGVLCICLCVCGIWVIRIRAPHKTCACPQCVTADTHRGPPHQSRRGRQRAAAVAMGECIIVSVAAASARAAAR